MTGPRAVLYLRVSTRDQDVATQERELRTWAERLGLEVVETYAETASGAATARAELRRLLADAHARRFGALLVWGLDRLGRAGIAETLRTLDQLQRAGVRVLSLREPWLDTQAPHWDLLAAVFAWVARFERERIAERVRAGMARARAQGRRIGRPPRPLPLEEIAKRRAKGWGWRRIARALKVPKSTLRTRCLPRGENPGLGAGAGFLRPERAAAGPGEGMGT